MPVAEVSPRLEAALAQASAADGDDMVEIVAVLRDQVNVAEVVAQSAQSAAVHTHNAAIYDALTDAAHASQDSLLAWLNARGVKYRAYYIVNMVLIYGDAALVDELRERPEIARLALNVATEGIESTPNDASSMALPAGWSVAPAAAQSVAPPWGISFIHAPEVWAMGYTGAGIVVASQDTGVQWDHPALQLAYRGWNTATMTATHTYNWFDAWGADGARASRCDGEAATNAQIPCDDNGHGTHTVGTMLGNASGDGGTIIGVAPDAKWIACRNMTSGVGSPTSYADCFQFFLAPYPQGGDPMTDGDPSRAPNIINNSWSCPTRRAATTPTFCAQLLKQCASAGQFVVSSAGNSGRAGVQFNQHADRDLRRLLYCWRNRQRWRAVEFQQSRSRDDRWQRTSQARHRSAGLGRLFLLSAKFLHLSQRHQHGIAPRGRCGGIALVSRAGADWRY